jgi:transposase InsO family protein
VVELAQYTSLRYTEHLALEGIAPSIGTVGDAYDNGLMEAIIGLYKTEAITTGIFRDGPLKPSLTSSTPPPAGRLVEPPPAALQHRPDPTRRTRAGLLCCPQPRATPRIGAAANP